MPYRNDRLHWNRRSFESVSMTALEWLQEKLSLPAAVASLAVVVVLLVSILDAVLRDPTLSRPRIVAGRRVSNLIVAAKQVSDGKANEAARSLSVSRGSVSVARALGWVDAAVLEAGGDISLVSRESRVDVEALLHNLATRAN